MNEKNTSESFADRLKKIRIDKKITQKDLVEKTGINRNTIYNYENEISNPDFENLKALQKALNVSYSYLIDGNIDTDVELSEKLKNIPTDWKKLLCILIDKTKEFYNIT